VRATDGLSSSEKPDFAFIGPPAYWIREPLRSLNSRNTRPLTNRSVPNILAQLSAEKQWVGGGGVYYTLPSLPILIRYKQEGVGIRVKTQNCEIFFYCFMSERKNVWGAIDESLWKT
jgi:hypothetical protein